MIRERVDIGVTPTEVCAVPYQYNGVLLSNTGTAVVAVDVGPDVAVDGLDAGLTIQPGQTATLPTPASPYDVRIFAVAAGAGGELTYLLPG
ncbi:hypothetical protein [uncultured Mycobacterium sp.]|uniref:hypothetical protein n=1 Tax=uncultured Mycobacterium sp. TaxID=171292 RepID=UPI0035CAC72E